MNVLNIIDGYKKMVDKYKIKKCNFLKKHYDASENKFIKIKIIVMLYQIKIVFLLQL